MTRLAEARRSVAITGAAVSAGTPLMMAVLPSRRISAPRRRISSRCMKRFSKMVSMMVPTHRPAVQRRELRLHVGGKSRIRRGADIHRLRPLAMHVEFDPVIAGFDFRTGLLQLQQHGFQMPGICVVCTHAATGDGASHKVGTGLDAIGLYRVLCTVKAWYAVDDERSVPAPWIFAPMAMSMCARSTTSGSRAAFSITVCPSASVAAIIRFSVPVTVHGVEHQTRTLEPRSARAHVTVFPRGSLHPWLQARDMNVHRPRTDGTAAGQRHIGLAEARQQRPEHQDRRAHGLHQLVGRDVFGDAARIHHHALLLAQRHLHAHARQQLDHRGDVLQVRHVAHLDRFIGQQGGGEDGQRRVLRAGNAYFPGESRSAGNLQLVHAV